MSSIDIKTTFYDIFGYIIPGFIAIFIFGITYGQFNGYPSNYVFCKIGSISPALAIFLLIVAYALGHAISSFSSHIIEKWFVPFFRNIPVINVFPKFSITKKNEFSSAFSSKFMENFKTHYEQTFNLPFSEKDIRLCITYVESKMPAVYSTAFVFLSFYGMARNLCLLFLFWIPVQFFIGYGQISRTANIYCSISIILFLIFLYEYIRFQRYFVQEIIYGFMSNKT